MPHHISNFDLIELASRMLGHSDEQFEKYVNDDEEDLIEEQLNEKFNIDLGDFRNLVCALLPMTPPVESAIGNEPVNCFGVHEKNYFRAIVRLPANIKQEIQES